MLKTSTTPMAELHARVQVEQEAAVATIGVFNMLVERLSNVEEKLDIVTSALKHAQETRDPRQINTRLFGWEFKMTVQPVPAQQVANALYVETDLLFDDLEHAVVNMIMSGVFDAQFPDADLVKDFVWEEYRHPSDNPVRCEEIGIDPQRDSKIRAANETVLEYCANRVLDAMVRRQGMASIWSSVAISWHNDYCNLELWICQKEDSNAMHRPDYFRGAAPTTIEELCRLCNAVFEVLHQPCSQHFMVCPLDVDCLRWLQCYFHALGTGDSSPETRQEKKRLKRSFDACLDAHPFWAEKEIGGEVAGW